LRFGEGHLTQTYYNLLIGNKNILKIWQLWTEYRAVVAFGNLECSHDVRDKIVCAQFIAVLSDGFDKVYITIRKNIVFKISHRKRDGRESYSGK